jgi:hypothetical protein
MDSTDPSQIPMDTHGQKVAKKASGAPLKTIAKKDTVATQTSMLQGTLKATCVPCEIRTVRKLFMKSSKTGLEVYTNRPRKSTLCTWACNFTEVLKRCWAVHGLPIGCSSSASVLAGDAFNKRFAIHSIS